MSDSSEQGFFGDWSQYQRAREDLKNVCAQVFKFPMQHEHERHFILAIIRRTLSLEQSFRQSVDSCNGQMAMTIIRLHLDSLARFYALYWADQTKGMSAETFARDVAKGASIKKYKFKGSKVYASDSWLINQIIGLADWIPVVYKKTCGAIHFSDFHITQLLQQAKPIQNLEDGSLQAEISVGPGEKDPSPEFYKETQQAFFHISQLLIVALQHRCELVFDQDS